MSEWQRPAPSTLTRTSPGPGAGFSTSRSSGSVCQRTSWTAFMRRTGSAQGFALEPDPGLLPVPRSGRDARLAELRLLHLVRLRARQLRDVLDEARDPVPRHPRGEELDQLALVKLGSGLEHDRDFDLLVAGRLLQVGV